MRLAIATAAVLALALSAGAEDVTIVYKTTGPGQPGTSTHYLSANMVRYQSGTSDTILDLKGGRIVTIDNAKKEWSEMTVAEIEAAMAAMTAKMDQAMAGMPPEMREKMKGMMGGVAGAMKVTKGGARTVAGYACDEYTLTMGAAFTRTSCNTTAIPLPFDLAQLTKLSLASNPNLLRMAGDMQAATKELQQIKGLAIAENSSVQVMGKSTATTKEATEIKKGPIPASAFEVPAGYKKVTSPLAKMGQK